MAPTRGAHSWLPRALGVLVLAALLPTSYAICYYPNGRVAEADQPCNDESEHSSCCGPGWACLSNKMCKRTDKVKLPADEYIRASCTDKEWRSGSCPGFCLSLSGGDEGMSLCPDSDTDSYCCLGSNAPCNCGNGTGVVSFDGKPKLGATIGHTKESTTSTAAPAQGTGNGSTPSRNSATTTGNAESKNSESNAADTSVKVGLGVGIPLGIMALVGFSMLFWRLRQQDQRMHILQQQLEARPSSAPPSSSGFTREWSEHDHVTQFPQKLYHYSKNEADSVQVGELGVNDRCELGGYTASEKPSP
ncbi:MAG: hypothetical protein M1823_005779 [Watsoniomyces obsoletus]|nr:MAG: hypothetical protein M1823_005779 [Watsoniomyces obsoletus]